MCRLTEVCFAKLSSQFQRTDRRAPPTDPTEPTLQSRELSKLLTVIVVGDYPGEDGYVSNREITTDVVASGESPIKDGVQPTHFVGVAPNGVAIAICRVLSEVASLTRHRPKPSHLPHQPLHDLVSLNGIATK